MIPFISPFPQIYNTSLLIKTTPDTDSRRTNKQAKMVKSLPFGDIQVPSPGFGAMGISFGLGNNMSLEEAEPVLLKAIELGCTFWDTAVSHLCGITQWHDVEHVNIGRVPSWCERKAAR